MTRDVPLFLEERRKKKGEDGREGERKTFIDLLQREEKKGLGSIVHVTKRKRVKFCYDNTPLVLSCNYL